MTGSWVTGTPFFSVWRARSTSAVERDAQAHLEAEAERQALVHQRGEPDAPSRC